MSFAWTVDNGVLSLFLNHAGIVATLGKADFDQWQVVLMGVSSTGWRGLAESQMKQEVQKMVARRLIQTADDLLK